MRVGRNELPDTVHGRLLEAIHLSGYTLERAWDELSWLLRQDRWRLVGPGYEDVDAFLASMDFSELRITKTQRETIVKQLAAIKAGQRTTARLLGVTHTTIQRDLATGTNVPSKSGKNADSKTEATEPLATAGTNVPVPYFSESGITIYHGDCREIVPALDAGLMVTDPPYNVGYHYNEYEDAIDTVDYWKFLAAALRPPFVVIHYPESLFPIAQSFGAPEKVVAWVYHANTPKQWRAVAWFGLTPDLTKDWQPYRNRSDKRIRALMAQGREARLYDWWEYEQVKNVSDEKTDHPCQIPSKLMQRILKVTPFDGPVIDPFCGSGTTLVAAQELGRRAIGIESSEEYCEVAANRLRQPSQLVLNQDVAR